jgi:hypothetical protein
VVHAKGGNGGIGGNGGNGANGVNGVNGNPGVITRQVPYKDHRVVHKKRFVEFSGIQNFYEHPGTNGTAGQNAGQGGKGGSAGKNGTTLIEGQWNNATQHTIATNGVDGMPGIPGMGGIHGRHCQGQINTNIDRWDRCWRKEGKENRHTAQPNQTPTAPGYAAPRGSAPNGVVPAGVNAAGQQPQTSHIPLDGNSLKHEYALLYDHEASINPMIRPFPNLRQ